MPGMKSRTVAAHAAAAALFAAMSVAVMWPALTRPAWWGVHDWAQFYSYFGVPLRAVMDEAREAAGWLAAPAPAKRRTPRKRKR